MTRVSQFSRDLQLPGGERCAGWNPRVNRAVRGACVLCPRLDAALWRPRYGEWSCPVGVVARWGHGHVACLGSLGRRSQVKGETGKAGVLVGSGDLSLDLLECSGVRKPCTELLVLRARTRLPGPWARTRLPGPWGRLLVAARLCSPSLAFLCLLLSPLSLASPLFPSSLLPFFPSLLFVRPPLSSHAHSKSSEWGSSWKAPLRSMAPEAMTALAPMPLKWMWSHCSMGARERRSSSCNRPGADALI